MGTGIMHSELSHAVLSRPVIPIDPTNPRTFSLAEAGHRSAGNRRELSGRRTAVRRRFPEHRARSGTDRGRSDGTKRTAARSADDVGGVRPPCSGIREDSVCDVHR